MVRDNPFEGRWRCPGCDREFGKHFIKCIYCKPPHYRPGYEAPTDDQKPPVKGKPAKGKK